MEYVGASVPLARRLSGDDCVAGQARYDVGGNFCLGREGGGSRVMRAS